MRRTHLVLWGLAAVLACWRLDPATRPITGDNQLYFYLAERAASGVAPHVSLVDTKSQLGVLATAAAISVGRTAGIDDVASSRAVSIAFAAGAVVLAAELASLLTASAAAGHVAALAMIASRGFVDHAATGSSPKVFLAAFLLLAHVAIARRAGGGAPTDAAVRSMPEIAARRRTWADVATGLAAGAAFLCWQPALLVLAAVVLEALAAREGSVRRAAVVLGAAAVPVAGYGLYFALHGALGAQLHQEFVMTLGSVHSPRRLAQSLAFVMTEARGASSPLRVGPISFAVVAAVVLARTVRRPRWLGSTPGALAFAAGAAAATAFTLYDHQGVPDLFFLAPYFAVSAGLVAGASAGIASVAAPAALVVLLSAQLARDEALRPARSFDLGDQRQLAEQVRVFADSGGVWVYEAVHLLGLAHLDNHVAYGLFYDDVRSVLDVEAWRPLRDGRMSVVIVHGLDGIPGSDAWLRDDFVESTPSDFAAQGLRVWNLRDQ